MNGLAGCYVSTIGKPHEYFDLTGTPNRRPQRHPPRDVICKKKIGQKQPTLARPKRAINAGSTFCGAQVEILVSIGASATAPKTRGRHSRAAAVSPNGGGRRAAAEERHSQELARDEP